jgi:uncharacterized protein (DUF2342 family)
MRAFTFQVAFLKSIWPMVMGHTIVNDDGQPETHIVPKALHHTGALYDDGVLHQLAIHELTHQCQFAANAGAVWQTFFPARRKMADTAVNFLLEGHARWTDRHVTRQIFGEAVDEQRTRRTLRYRMLKNLPVFKGLYIRGREPYELGSRFVSAAITAAGVDTLNRAWKDTALIPTRNEIDNPHMWSDRVAL